MQPAIPYNNDERTPTTMPPETEDREVSVNRLSFPLQVVIFAVTTAVSVVASSAVTSASIKGEVSELRQTVAVQMAKQEARDDAYRDAIRELKADGVTQKEDLQKQIRALEYVVNEIKIDLAKRR